MDSTAPVFVTGAGGFIGGKLVERLLELGRPVRALSRRPLPALAARGVEVIVGDLLDTPSLCRGCDGAGTVFHVAGRVGVWGPEHDFRRINVEGTRAVLGACRIGKVPRLVYTSSPSVVYNGQSLSGVDESMPYVTDCPCAYPATKAEAERDVLSANSHPLATIALRPHLVWGPGDRNLVPRIVELARKGRLKIVGDGRNRVDLTYVVNVVDAHLAAEQVLVRLGGAAGGRAYFITNGEPVVLWDWINTLLLALSTPPVKKHISVSAAYAAGAACEALWGVLPLKGEPPMTRFAAKELATDHWFKIDAARRELGYTPRVSMADGTRELIAHLRKSGVSAEAGR